MSSRRIIVVGGGAAGFFAAITCAETAPDAEVTILERSSQFLSKVRISGGGRCNVTHACFDPQELTARFPRGAGALLAPFKMFPASDTVAWFESRGVKLKAERDGRIFPVSDSSQTIIDCLLHAAKGAKVRLVLNCGVKRATKRVQNGFELTLSKSRPTPPRNEPDAQREPLKGIAEERRGAAPRPEAVPFGKDDGEQSGNEKLTCDRLLLATGGCRTAAAGQLSTSLGHTFVPPVPSLFTFHVENPWLRELAGISVETVEASVPDARLRERGALLLTHWGLSGPVILRLSAWGARTLHGMNYRFPLHLHWLPGLDAESISAGLDARRQTQPARLIIHSPISPLPARLWEQLALAAGIARDTRWAGLSRAGRHRLVQQLMRTEFQVTGKSLNKEEFVTCGGVRLSEVNFKTMESRICPGLYFAGELLDIDGLTGGFNFQAAWTTGWIAGRAMARRPGSRQA